MAAQDSPTLSKGVLVQIHGLASEAGKPLNEAYGLIARGNPGNGRYPVLVYALPRVPKTDDGDDDDEQQPQTTHEVIKTLVIARKSFKGDNLRVVREQKQMLFQEFVSEQLLLAHQSDSHPGALPWYEAYCDRWPDGDGDLGVVMTYVQFLLETTEGAKKALGVIDGVKHFFKSSSGTMTSHPMKDSFIVSYVQVCTAAGERIEEAWEDVSQIDTGSEAGRQLASRALQFLLTYASEQNETDVTREHPELLDLQVRVARRMFELNPNGMNNLYNVGAALCLQGNYLEGCKCYRRAMQTDNVDPSVRRYREVGLIEAQLQCPGMPLEGYIIVAGDDRTVTCIKESDREYLQIEMTGQGVDRHGIRRCGGSLNFTGNDGESATAIQYPLPLSPDDHSVFSELFLASLNDFDESH